MATYGYMGRQEDAEWMAMDYETLEIPATIRDIVQEIAFGHPPCHEVVAEGLRLAVLPE